MTNSIFYTTEMPSRIPHIIENGIERKRCCKCKEYKYLSEFGKSMSSWDKLRPTCRECVKVYNRKYVENMVEKQVLLRESQVSWRPNPLYNPKDDARVAVQLCRCVIC